MSGKDIRILIEKEGSSMASCWMEYLCVEQRDGQTWLSIRRYEALALRSDYEVDSDSGDETYDIPEFIDGRRVAGIEDEHIVGGELGLDPCNVEPAISVTSSEPGVVTAWLERNRFPVNAEVRRVLAEAVRQPRTGAGTKPNVAGSDGDDGSGRS